MKYLPGLKPVWIMKISYLNILSIFLCIICSCNKTEPESDKIISGPSVDEDSSACYVVNLDEVYQEIDNFGASDAWTTKYVGKNWPLSQRNKMADLLFSMELDSEGKPIGIGLSLWRMLLGAGSDRHSGMEHEWQTMGCIRSEDGDYDLSEKGVSGGSFWMLKAAKERGVEQFLGFCNSPPYYYTCTGMTNASQNDEYMYKLNIKDEYLDDYATYLAEIVKRTKEEHGIDFKYICPLNEPEWQADGMESCHANNYEVASVAKAVSSAFKEYGLTTKVVIPESGKLHFIYTYDPLLGLFIVDPRKYGWKAKNFFSKDGEPECYLGDLDNVAKLLAAHSYWSVNTDNELRQIRTEVGEEINKYGIKYWQTEFCILSNDYDLGTNPDGSAMGGGGRDYSMKLALYVARIIYADLVFGNASAWHWWLGATGVDYKDGLLYLIGDPYYGEVRDSKLLWAFGNYSRFIRPGAYRVGISSEDGDVDNLHGVMFSAYKNLSGNIVVVAINYTDEGKDVNIEVSDGKDRKFIPYVTSDAEGDDLRPLEKISNGELFTIPARSVVTFCESLTE